MTLDQEIERMFSRHDMPRETINLEGRFQIDSDVEEAEWFTGRDWRSITWEDWQEHPVAFRFFSKDAFLYFLPSVLLLSLRNPKGVQAPAESVISDLDRSPDPSEWDPRFKDRYLDFRTDEYELLKEWLLRVCGYAPYKGWGIAASGPGDTFGRAFDTVDLLKKEAERSNSASGLA